MNKVLLSVLLGGMLALAPAAQAQSEPVAPIEYSERVPSEGSGRTLLYRRAYDWMENHFAYGPKSVIKADPAAGSLRVTGTSKIKPVDTKGKEQEVAVRFDFTFRATDNGYEYSVNTFQAIPDSKQPSQALALDEYITRFKNDKADERTHNARRLTAQASSVASEIAMSFRSYMNSQPAEGTVGVSER
ncbi:MULTISPECIES: DUF4468 domain-containing protein [Hymenobacter]|nr:MULTISPECIES: DUF4468 domain-containing protein [Hymenobacter]